ncbi:hypothetical protein AN964_24170 [Heyndrickxia shackletonii]|uniref:Uncharacterized protein n=1 Tax=Heyndrickxia shackletonii TaxID=157838 RepID=A0A0Q3WS40_9BACI|nr:CBO0543 family protein [Heyndrickxia shackletonii]KQL50725.1 hypothetical protein AN964_24170 [Heyndrickxia shackletonii]MBB2480367.1 hypothetical protein [Bacillus sp. APMAM]NEZ02495.1 hypothetical protein [Heyndrickxia shackletonii]RTZ56256.1 hypothetical protein EKO25_08835 [Bacillus sp. SAJ1]
MNRNIIIETLIWIISFLLLFIFVPKQKIRDAWVSFLFMQLPAWILGLAVVQYGLIEYPSRFFAHAVRTSFTFEFLAFPVISVLFNIHYPTQKGFWWKIFYVFAFPTILVPVEVLILRYTDLVKYIHWTWYTSWISIMLTLLLSYLFYKWFNKKNNVSKGFR